MSNNSNWFLDLVLNSAVSAGIGWLISAYYFRKATRAEIITEQIKFALQKSFFPIVHPQFFDPSVSQTLLPNQRTPNDTDIPHIEYALLSEQRLHPTKKFKILLKLRDSGFDLENPAGIRIWDHRDRAISVAPVGLGYCMAEVFLDPDVEPGEYDIRVQLLDLGEHSRSGPNQNTQTITIRVAGGQNE